MKKFIIKIHPVTKHSQGLFKVTKMTFECESPDKKGAEEYAKEVVCSLESVHGRLTATIEEL
jgi:hypothetical protein